MYALTREKEIERKTEEMACRVQRRISLRRKILMLRAHINSKSGKTSSIDNSTVLYMYKLKVMLETVKREYATLIATRREYLNSLKRIQEQKNVKVEKVSEGNLVVRVTCEKGGDKLVAILEAFEELCLNVVEASVSCNDGFVMEASVEAEGHSLDVRDVTEALHKAIGRQSGEKVENYCN